MNCEELDTSHVYFIQTEGPGGLENTEVLITDLGEIGEDAIVVFEEAVGVGAEETVIEGSGIEAESNAFLQADSDIIQVLPGDGDKLDTDEFSEVKLEADLGVHYETVDNSSLEDTNSVLLRVDLDDAEHTKAVISPSQGLPNLVKRDSSSSTKRKFTAGSGGGKLAANGDKSEVYLCKLCNSYISTTLMDTHNRDVHGNADRLACSDCDKLFTSKRSLFGHKKEKHSGTVEIFMCPDCGKNFSRKSNLKAHRDSLHFGKKFPCTFCDRIFTNRSSMNQHMKKTHNI